MRINTESLDTNILVRLIVRDIEPQYRAATKLISRKDVLFVIDEMAISEAVYVLKRVYGYDRMSIRESLLQLLEMPNFSCNRGVIEDALLLYTKYPSWSYDDCYLVVKTALSQSEPLWTFDHKLATQSGVVKEVK